MDMSYDQLLLVIEQKKTELEGLVPGSEEHKRASDEYVAYLEMKLKFDKLVADAKQQDAERKTKIVMQEKEIKSKKKETLIKVGVVGGCFGASLIVENLLGGARSKLGDIIRNIKIW